MPATPATSPFTAGAARALPGPGWLRQRRVEAAERFAAEGLPSTEEEVWRYSRVADLDLDAYTLAPAGDGAPAHPAVPPAVAELLEAHPRRAATVVAVNGEVVHAEVDLRWAERGVTAGVVADADDSVLGSVAGEPPDVFTVMNDAFSAAPLVVRVPPGVALDAPVVVVNWFEGEGVAVFPRLVVDLGADAEAAVLDLHASPPDSTALSAPVVELAVGRAGHLGYLNVQDLGLRAWQIASQLSRVEAEATLVAAAAGFGGEYARQRTDCRLVGRGSTGNLVAVYFGEADQTLDFRTFQDHAAPDTTSDLLFKGAVSGRSRSVYTGLIKVRKEARGTNAFQTNRNIKLSEDAWAESVPNLEIENNDVSCSHASAVGPIDEDQRFYLESRGVPPAVAERLVVSGFFEDVVARVPVASAMGPLRAAVAGKLARSEVGK